MIICELCHKQTDKLDRKNLLCLKCSKTHKKCIICANIKLHNEFYIRNIKTNLLNKKCKNCIVIVHKNYYDNNINSILIKKQNYYENNKIKIYKYRKENEENIKTQKKEYDKNNKVKKRQYRIKNKENLNFKRNERQKNKKLNDPVYKFMSNISTEIYLMFKFQNSSKNGISSKNKLPSGTPEEYIQHIESLWAEEMNWKNHGKCSNEKFTWQIDHIIPQSLLKYSSYDDLNFKICWDKQNLRPLSSEENLEKSNKLTEEGKILLQKLTEKYKGKL